MADDVKIQLGIDVEALQRSATQATSILSKAFEQQSLGPNLLGSGIPATQLPQAGNKDTLRGVIDALDRIERTLTTGFLSLAGVSTTGITTSGGGSVGGRGGGGGGGGTRSPGRGEYGWGDALSRAGNLSSALMPSSMAMFTGGFYGTDVMRAVGSAVSQIPVIGGLLNSMLHPFQQEMESNDDFKNKQYHLYRDAGKDAMDTFTDMWTQNKGGGGAFDNYTSKYGFSRDETAQMIRSGSRAGLDLSTTAGQQGMGAIFNMQGALGLGQEAAQATGDFRKAGGASGKEMDMFASAIGVAVSTGLERGRWGEMLTMWSRAAQSSIDTDISMKGVTEQQNMIGSLGDRFKGDSPAAQSMNQALMGAAGNAQSPLALRAAMQLTGGDYFAATARMARAAQTPDTEMEGKIIDQLAGGLRGNETDAELERMAGVAATMGTGLSQLKIFTLLKARNAGKGGFKGPSPEQLEIARRQISPDTDSWNKAVGIALGPRRAETMKQRPSDITKVQPVGGGVSVAQQVRDLESMRDAVEAMPAMGDLYQRRQGPGAIGESSGRESMLPSVMMPGTPTTQGSSEGISGAISGLGELSSDEIRAAAEKAGIPAETLRSWFKIESAGMLRPDSGDFDGKGNISARGLNRMSLEEAKSLGYSEADWKRMSSDKKLSLDASAKLAAKYFKQAQQMEPNWKREDQLHLMKLQHGGTGYRQKAFNDYRKQHGGKDPGSWDDFYNAEEPRMPGSPGKDARGALQNANKITVNVIVENRSPGTTVRGVGPNVTTSQGQLGLHKKMGE